MHMSVLHEANVLLLCQSTSRAGATHTHVKNTFDQYCGFGGGVILKERNLHHRIKVIVQVFSLDLVWIECLEGEV